MRLMYGTTLAVSLFAAVAMVPGNAEVRTGDAIGIVTAFDAGRQVLTLNGAELKLDPRAKDSLVRQLAAYGWDGVAPFGATLNISKNSVGLPVIVSIDAAAPAQQRKVPK